MPVRVLHSGANLAEQLEALAQRQLAVLAMPRDRCAGNILHDEVRQTVAGRTAVQQTSDIGMLEAR